MVALGLVDPLPAQILAEVNIELPHAAVLLRGAAGWRGPGQGGAAAAAAAARAAAPPGWGGTLVAPSTAPISVIIAITVTAMIITNTDKALSLVKPLANGIVNIISHKAPDKPVRKSNDRPPALSSMCATNTC